MNKIFISLLLVISFVAAPALAKKPESAGDVAVENRQTWSEKIKADEMEKTEKNWNKREHASEAREMDERYKDEKQKYQKKDNDVRGLEKQEAKKSEQVQKELDKGSETGQEARQNRRKWWKFWGE